MIVINHDPVTPLELCARRRIAQLVFQRVEQPRSSRSTSCRSPSAAPAATARPAAPRRCDAPSRSSRRSRRRRSGAVPTQAEAHRALEARRHPAVGAARRATSREPTTARTTSATRPTTRSPRVDLGALRVPVGDRARAAGRGRTRRSRSCRVTLVGAATGRCSSACSPRRATKASGTRCAPRSPSRSRAAARHRPSDDDGEFGTELTGTLPADGGTAPVRFIGVDGPRWFLRAMLVGAGGHRPGQGRARSRTRCATSSWCAGTDPLPVREPVPLRLPKDVALPDDECDRATERRTATRGYRWVRGHRPSLLHRLTASHAAPRRRRAASRGRRSCPCTPLDAAAPRRDGRRSTGRLRSVVYTPRETVPDPRGRAVRRHGRDRAGLARSAPHRRHRAGPHGCWRAAGSACTTAGWRSTTPGTSCSDPRDVAVSRRRRRRRRGDRRGPSTARDRTAQQMLRQHRRLDRHGHHRDPDRRVRHRQRVAGLRPAIIAAVGAALAAGRLPAGAHAVGPAGAHRPVRRGHRRPHRRPHRPGPRLLPARHLDQLRLRRCRSLVSIAGPAPAGRADLGVPRPDARTSAGARPGARGTGAGRCCAPTRWRPLRRRRCVFLARGVVQLDAVPATTRPAGWPFARIAMGYPLYIAAVGFGLLGRAPGPARLPRRTPTELADADAAASRLVSRRRCADRVLGLGQRDEQQLVAGLQRLLRASA